VLEQMNLKDCVVTFDAMNTQKGTVRIIRQQKGDYVGNLKANHPLFHSEVSLLFSEEECARLRKKKTGYRVVIEKAHNCIEKREYYMMTDIQWFADLSLWEGLKAFVCYDKTTEDPITGSKSKERRFYITSLKDIELCADAIRGHWGVENQLHWHLDVAFAEDENTTMDKNAFHNLSILNKIALTLYKLLQPTLKIGLKSIRKSCGWDYEGRIGMLFRLFDEDALRDAMLTANRKT